LYRVHRPNQGLYFGVHDPATRRIRTERTEQAARAVADEMNLQLTGEQDVSHDQWLRLTGIRADAESKSDDIAPKPAEMIGFPAPSAALQPDSQPAQLGFDAEPVDALVLKKDSSCFSTDAPPIAPPDAEVEAQPLTEGDLDWIVYRPTDP
jgi:hypothetical protein